MPVVTFTPLGKSVEVPEGHLLLDAARAAGGVIDAPCGGKGVCGKCIVRVTNGHVEPGSLSGLTPDMAAEGYVLACKTRVGAGPVTVELPGAAREEQGKFTDGDDIRLVQSELLPREWEYGPLAVKWLFQVPPAQPEDGLSDFDRLTRAIRREWGNQEVMCPLRILRVVADALRAEDGLVTVTLVFDGGRLHMVRVEPGNRTTRHFAVAVDVGTTTVAVQLINLTVARVMATRTAYNDQIRCGLDVISRINYARTPERLEELRTRVLTTVNTLVAQAAESQGVAPEEITNAVISANTTMNHLLLGMNPEHIRLAPYTPTLMEIPYLTASEAGIAINPDSWVCFSPNNGSYVGGDITAGLLCTDLATDTETVNLFIDIGTNGELVVGNNEFLLSCACSAGPAFEGGGIGCGMRAAAGAIERVEVDPVTGSARHETIGNLPPAGICGSGMIDLLANLFLTGWIDPAGKFDRSRPCPAIRVEGKRASYVLASSAESATGARIEITELDIDNILRAKAAIYSACTLLMEQVGIAPDDLGAVYIAGGFGRFLPLDKAIVLGLLPDIPRERFRFIGNASLTGSYMLSVSQDFRRRQLELARRMTYIDLSNAPGYMDEYMSALFLPHTDSSRFPSVAAQTQKG
jgi:uncharacterized 2Fe-2S/4Fe-4S cluster protein (DUF4445 family)